jgi:hypothetical protein
MNLSKNISVVKLLVKLLDGINWRLVGSTNLALQGVDVEANDVDLQIPVESVDLVNQKLVKFVINPIKFSETEIYKSYFGQFEIDGVLVEVMTDNPIKASPKKARDNVIISLGDKSITCASLQEEYDGAVIRGKVEKVQAIRKKL